MNFAQMDDQLEEEALVIATASAFLGAMTIFLKYYERKEVETEIEMSQIPCQPRINRDIDREIYINRTLLCRDRHCIDQIRISPLTFFRLCQALEGKGLLVSTVNMSVKEQVLMFLHLVGHIVRFRAIKGRFFRSTCSIHTYFHIVLQAILKLYPTNRPNNSFKSSSFVATVNAISKKFNVKCFLEHIDNHLKTAVISKLRNKESGFGWDDNLKMIIVSYNTYTDYLNKKIDIYNEMAIVVGKDVAQGSSARSFDDVEIYSHGDTTNLEGDGDSEFMKDNDKQSISSAPLELRKIQKRTLDDDLELQNISNQMGEVAYKRYLNPSSTSTFFIKKS
ncbi:hypothetical protein Cgig2_020685 [Carnegiea gigantea]|uniref:DUF8040 domain-containing protein n=1 Tax=Carnegiea gigantea TaxID=171969 RepID=A0A9Q1JWS1_9CARY|nr:hypothetical protein Cgig2_020685 [Carnegiea gigantea]